MSITGDHLHADAIGLRLIRHDSKNRAHFCEPVFFERGRVGVELVLLRASLAGRVEVNGEIKEHQADVLIGHDGEWEQVVALDAGSYRALKNHWMRCKIEAVE
jgi:hypothetical protein